jgi:uncharacterized protein YdeI (YjbR/CyaY-like superfamily)
MPTITGHIAKSTLTGSYLFCQADMSEHGFIKICDHEISFEIPEDFNPALAEAAMLKTKLDAINEEHSKQVMVIKKRIADLLCIENTVTA